MRNRSIAVAALILLVVPVAFGAIAEQQKLVASDAAANDEFGNSASVDGSTVIIGAPEEDDGGANAGAAYVYVRAGATWTQQQKLTASDAQAGDQFGRGVAIDGDTVIIGAPEEDAGGADAGAAYVFTRSGGVWTEQQKLTASDAQAGDQFGFAVAISGETVLVGAYLEDAGGADAGAAYVFTRSGGVWTEQQKLTASDAQAGDQFGPGVAIDGETAVVGAHREDAGGADAGAAYVFTRSGGVWTEQQKLTASDAAASDRFGWAVSISGATTVIGALTADSGAGAVYVYVRAGGSWTEQDKLIANDAAANDFAGTSVGIDGDTVIVGAEAQDTGGADAGAAYVFIRSGTTWQQQAKLVSSDAAAGDNFGRSAGLSGDTAIVGAWRQGGSSAGAAYVFTGVPLSAEKPTTPTGLSAVVVSAFDLTDGDAENAVVELRWAVSSNDPDQDVGLYQYDISRSGFVTGVVIDPTTTLDGDGVRFHRFEFGSNTQEPQTLAMQVRAINATSLFQSGLSCSVSVSLHVLGDTDTCGTGAPGVGGGLDFTTPTDTAAGLSGFCTDLMGDSAASKFLCGLILVVIVFLGVGAAFASLAGAPGMPAVIAGSVGAFGMMIFLVVAGIWSLGAAAIIILMSTGVALSLMRRLFFGGGGGGG